MKQLVVTIGLVLCASMAAAESGTDPNWPCIQRKQPHLSLGQVWTGPEPDDAIRKLASTPEIVQLAEKLEQRRVTPEEIKAEVAAFAKTADNQKLTALMVAIFERTDSYRTRLIDGIARYGHRQVSLSDQIEKRREKMEDLEKADKPDFDAIDAEEKALDWDTRIFTEGQQSLTYVCDTPVLIEQRLFAIGREIATYLRK